MMETPRQQIRTVTLRAAMKEAVDLYRAEKYDECQALCREVLTQKAGHAHALHLLGVVEMQRGNDEAAIPYFEQALSRLDDNAEFHSNFGSLLSRLKRRDEAIWHLRRAIDLKPDYVEAHANLGSVYLDESRFTESLAAFQAAERLDPKREGPPIGAGCAHKQLLQFPESVACFRRAIAINAENAEAHSNLAMVLLQMGAFREGWREYEWRFKSKSWGSRTFRQPRWSGESLVKRKVLIPSEQGLGDTIQFVRYLPHLKALGAKVAFECRQELQSLLNGFPGIDLMIDWPRSSDVETGVDCYIPLMSLPLHFDTNLTNITAKVPYLGAPYDVTEAWRQRFAGMVGCKVGLVWSGNPLNLKDHLRSCRLADFAPLACISDVSYFSLQKGAAAEQARHPPLGMDLIDIQAELSDFRETAGAIANLDLIITVDTSVAHLAGAMGKPVWILLPFSPDWRWLLERDDSPWYPTMRLFRQSRCGDWSDTFQRVATALRAWAPRREPIRILRDPHSMAGAVHSISQGNVAETEQAYRRVILDHPYHADAIQRLAGLLFLANRIQESIEWFQRLTRLQSGDAVHHFNLGVALAKLGNRDEAAASYERALAVDPNAAEVHFNLANLQRDQGRVDDALVHYRLALAAKPDYAKARMNLANLLKREGRLDEAAAEFTHALVAQPHYARTHLGLADTLRKLGNVERAMHHLREAVRFGPNSIAVLREAGQLFLDLDVLNEALACFDGVLEQQPQDPAGHCQRAAALCRLRRGTEAANAMRQALSLRARSPRDAHLLAKVAIDYFGWIDEGDALLEECLRHDPKWPEVHFDLGEVRRFQGRWEESFAEQTWRTEIKSFQRVSPTEPRWDGSVQREKTLLLYGEQGFGDMIQYIRYLPLVTSRVGRVLIGVPPTLVRLFAALPNVAAVADRGESLGPFDLCASILDLPKIFGTSADTIPADVPYLHAPERVGDLPATSKDRLKVGLVWAGNRSHAHDFKRSCPWSDFRELLACTGVAFYSLQFGDRLAPLEDRAKMVDLAEHISDWADTAEIINQLDLIISVDTGVAHLAAALAKPVWLLLPSVPDARWLLNRHDSPWYPTMRLYRQERLCDWGSVIGSVVAELRQGVGPRISSKKNGNDVEKRFRCGYDWKSE